MAASRQPQTAGGLTRAELELRAMWQDAELEFSQLTRRSLRTDREKRLEDVLAELDRKYQPPDEVSKDAGAKAKAKIRHTIGQVLNCIQLLGGLAAQGASIVFGPATLCFNAISFLIDVPSKIASVYEGVGNLFEEISHFLVLFKIYEDYTTLDPGLRDGTHKIMMSMVRICALSIKIIEGGVLHHIKIGAKITFLNDDSGVKAELAKFKALVDKQSHITEAVTLKYVLSSEGKLVTVLNAQYENAEKLNSIEGNMSLVAADVKDRKTQIVLSEQVDQIATMLSMTRESADDARKSMRVTRDSLVNGGGQWLMDHDEYKEWKSSEADSVPVLLLSGHAKTGKTTLLAVIEEDFRRTGPKTAYAYYEFSGRDTRGSKDKHKEDLVSALKSMALQLAGQFRPYARELAALKAAFKTPEAGKEREPLERLWWDKLLFSKYTQPKERFRFVLMFDGLEQLEDNNRGRFLKFIKLIQDEARLSTEAVRQNMRIVATGTPETFDRTTLTLVNVAEYNSADIKLYIEEEVGSTEVLQGQHVEILDLLRAVRTTLPEVARGSFAIVQQKLERVKEAVESDAYLDDVDTILGEDPADDLGKLARKVLRDLSITLTAHEIEQLNELLHWCVFGRRVLNIDELRAAVFLNSGRTSLQPFERKLRKKYAKVLRVDQDLVNVEYDIYDFFTSQPESTSMLAPVTDLDNATITMTVSINKADQRSIQQFFWDLTERVGIGKFDFLHKSDNNGKGVVQTDEVRAHFHITEQLLKLLNDDVHKKTEDLVRYALQYLPWHLTKIYQYLGQGRIDKSEWRNVAKTLVDLFSDVEGIKQFWAIAGELSPIWLTRANAKIFRDWLVDAKKEEALQPKERRWVQKHTAETEGKGGIFRPMALMVARRWLRENTWGAYEAYIWIKKYIALQESKDDEDEDADSDSENDITLHTEKLDGISIASERENSFEKQVTTAAKWVQQTLSLDDDSLDALWYERLAETFADEFVLAKKYYEKAKEYPGYRWTVNQGWAIAVEEMGALEADESKQKELKELACKEMEIVIEELRLSTKSADAGIEDRQALVSNLKLMAEWQEALHFIDRAFALYEEAIEVNPQEHATRGELLQALYAQNRLAEAKDMLLRMTSQDRELAELSLFSALLLQVAGEEYLSRLQPMHIILFLGQEDDNFNGQVLEALERALANARTNNLTMKEGVLLLNQGIALTRGPLVELRMQQAIRCWGDCQYLRLKSRYDLEITRTFAIRLTAQHYFHQATNPAIANEERQRHFKQLLKLHRQTVSDLGPDGPMSYLASYYIQTGQVEEARKLYMEDMTLAIDLLSDEDPDNDSYAYKLLANVSMCAGDDLNALSAWSLLGPSDVTWTREAEFVPTEDADVAQPSKNALSNTTSHDELDNAHSDSMILSSAPPELGPNDPKSIPESLAKEVYNKPPDSTDRTGPINFGCDGFCRHDWWYANDIYMCRHCPNTQFNGACLTKLKANKLERYVCHPEHSWLHVPPWSDEAALKIGQGNVRVGGQLVDGKRVGGDVVTIQEWVEDMRKTWGVPKPEPIVELSYPKRR